MKPGCSISPNQPVGQLTWPSLIAFGAGPVHPCHLSIHPHRDWHILKKSRGRFWRVPGYIWSRTQIDQAHGGELWHLPSDRPYFPCLPERGDLNPVYVDTALCLISC